MLKNKKKLRRLERKTPGYAVKTAQSLVLAGALVGAMTLGGAGIANAAAALTDVTWGAATTIDATNNPAVLDGAVQGKHVATSLTITGSSLTLKNSSFVFGQADPYTGVPTAALTVSGGALTVQDSQIAMLNAAISDGKVNVSGTIVDGAASDEGHWRNGAQIYGDTSVTISGGEVNISNNGQILVGRSGNNSDLNVLAVSGGTVNISNGLLRATSIAGTTMPSDNGNYSKITIGGASDNAIVNTAAGTHNVIASRLTEISAKGQLNINGATALVGTLTEATPGTKPSDAPDAWKYLDQAAAGKLTNTGGTITVADSGVLIATGIDYAQSNGTFTTSKLTLNPTSPASFKEGDGAVFKSVDISGGQFTVDSLTIDAGKLNASSANAGEIKLTGGELYIKNGVTLANTADVTNSYTGEMTAGKLALTDATKAYTQNTGALTLLGTAPTVAFLDAVSLSVTGGAVNLGDSGVNAHTTIGGTYGKAVTVSGGALNVKAGTWKLTDTTTGVASNSAGGLVVAGGTLEVNKLISGNTTGVIVGDGSGNAGGTLIVGEFGTSSGNVVINGATATLKTGWDQAIGQTAGAYDKQNAILTSTKGSILLTGRDKYTLDDLKAANKANGGAQSGALVSSSGTLVDANGNAITNITSDKLGDVQGGLLNVTLTNNAAAGTVSVGGVNPQNVGFKSVDLKGGDLTVVNNSTLTVVGNITTTDATKTITLGDGSNNTGTLILGSTLAASGGVISTGITTAGTGANQLTLAAGNFTMQGGINKNSNILNMEVAGGSLGTTKAIDISGLIMTGGVLGTVTKGTADGDVTIGGNANLTGGMLNAGNDLTINAFNNGAADAVSNATIVAAGDMTLTTGNMNAKGVTLLVDGELKANTGTITAADASKFTIGTLDQSTNAGAVTVSGASSLNVTNLKGNTSEDIIIGAAGDKVDGSVLIAAKTDLNGGGLQVLNAKASLGELTAASGSIFVDPAYVNISGITGNFGAALLAGKEGVITVGDLSEAWVKQAIKESGAPADSSVLGLQKGITLAAGGSIVVDKAVDNQGKIGGAGSAITGVYFGDKSLLAIDGSKFLDPAKAAAITADVSHALHTSDTAGEEARLHITGVKTGDTVRVVSGLASGAVDLDDATKGWDSSNINFDTLLFYGEGATNATGTVYNVDVKGVHAGLVFPKLSSGMAGLVDNVMAQYGLQTESANAGVRFVSRAVSNSYGLGGYNADSAAATIEGAAQMGAVAGVQVSTIGAAQAASGAVTTRTSFAQPLMDMTKAVAVHQDADGALSLDSGLSAGNGMKNGLGVWIMPLYQSNKTWGQKAENFKSGISSDLGGIALGADYTIDDMFRFGAAFNVGGGYAQSSGDFNKTDNNFNFWGVNLYGGWTMNNFGVSADVGYTSNYNKVEQDMPTSMVMGNLKSDITSSAWTAGLKGEYKFETSVVDIVPHIGVRYMGLTTDSYDVKSGGTVFAVEQDFQSIWTFPIGVAFSKTITSDSGWMFKPQVDLSVIPAAGDIEAKSKAKIPGVMGDAEMKMQVVDYVTFDGGVGFEVGKDNVSFGLNYNIQASEHRTGHGVFGTLRYEF